MACVGLDWPFHGAYSPRRHLAGREYQHDDHGDDDDSDGDDGDSDDGHGASNFDPDHDNSQGTTFSPSFLAGGLDSPSKSHHGHQQHPKHRYLPLALAAAQLPFIYYLTLWKLR